MMRFGSSTSNNKVKLVGQLALIIMSTSLYACSQDEGVASNASDAVTTINSIKAESSHQNINTSIDDTLAFNEANGDVTISKNKGLMNVSATVYKDPNCGCCGQWIDHAEDAGMVVSVQHPEQLNLFKDRYGVPKNMRSCHTTVTEDGYVFEGHIPAKYIAEFLANPPSDAMGLSVPGMPVGSPGMEYQGKFMPYDILQINKDGSTEVYKKIATLDEQT